MTDIHLTTPGQNPIPTLPANAQAATLETASILKAGFGFGGGWKLVYLTSQGCGDINGFHNFSAIREAGRTASASIEYWQADKSGQTGPGNNHGSGYKGGGWSYPYGLGPWETGVAIVSPDGQVVATLDSRSPSFVQQVAGITHGQNTDRGSRDDRGYRNDRPYSR